MLNGLPPTDFIAWTLIEWRLYWYSFIIYLHSYFRFFFGSDVHLKDHPLHQMRKIHPTCPQRIKIYIIYVCTALNKAYALSEWRFFFSNACLHVQRNYSNWFCVDKRSSFFLDEKANVTSLLRLVLFSFFSSSSTHFALSLWTTNQAAQVRIMTTQSNSAQGTYYGGIQNDTVCQIYRFEKKEVKKWE